MLEYWDWSENYAYINLANRGDRAYYVRTRDSAYWNSSDIIYLSDYYDMSFAAYRLYTPSPTSNPDDNPPPPGDGPRD